MKSIKMALLGGAALAVTAASAQADDLEALKAQIEALNTRVAAMEAAPAVPAGFQLIAISEGDQLATPGLEMTSRERALFSKKVNTISVLPTADAPAGATITWTGFVRAGLVWQSGETSGNLESRANENASWSQVGEDFDGESDDLDVFATANLAVKAVTDTAVGEIGVSIQIEAEYDGIESEEDYTEIEVNKAWGYWAMTPELTFGGGYAGSLGNIGYGMDGACTCHYYNTVGFNPGDTSQMRLTYSSGPFSAAIALEDATWPDYKYDNDLAALSDDALGVAGEIKYSGDMFSGEISGVWRDLNDDDDDYSSAAEDFIGSEWWQVGVGVGFGLGEVASVSLAAAMGEGPATTSADNNVPGDDSGLASLPWNSSWWGVSGIITGHLTDEIHAEIGAGYKEREFDDFEGATYDWSADGDEWVIGAGLYYNPVDQLTIGLEASYTETSASVTADDPDDTDTDYRVNADSNDTLIALLSVWRF